MAFSLSGSLLALCVLLTFASPVYAVALTCEHCLWTGRELIDDAFIANGVTYDECSNNWNCCYNNLINNYYDFVSIEICSNRPNYDFLASLISSPTVFSTWSSCYNTGEAAIMMATFGMGTSPCSDATSPLSVYAWNSPLEFNFPNTIPVPLVPIGDYTGTRNSVLEGSTLGATCIAGDISTPSFPGSPAHCIMSRFNNLYWLGFQPADFDATDITNFYSNLMYLTGVIGGDPHVIGFDNSRFDVVDVEDSSVINLLNDHNIVINSRVSTSSDLNRKPMYLKEAGVTIGANFQLFVDVVTLNTIDEVCLGEQCTPVVEVYHYDHLTGELLNTIQLTAGEEITIEALINEDPQRSVGVGDGDGDDELTAQLTRVKVIDSTSDEFALYMGDGVFQENAPILKVIVDGFNPLINMTTTDGGARRLHSSQRFPGSILDYEVTFVIHEFPMQSAPDVVHSSNVDFVYEHGILTPFTPNGRDTQFTRRLDAFITHYGALTERSRLSDPHGILGQTHSRARWHRMQSSGTAEVEGGYEGEIGEYVVGSNHVFGMDFEYNHFDFSDYYM